MSNELKAVIREWVGEGCPPTTLYRISSDIGGTGATWFTSDASHITAMAIEVLELRFDEWGETPTSDDDADWIAESIRKGFLPRPSWAGRDTAGGLKWSLRDDADDTPMAWSIWQVEDVYSRASEMNFDISEQEAADVLSTINNNHDATLGISWETIDFWLDELRREKENDR